MKPKIALCVGHSRTIGTHRDGGAVSWDGKTNEWTFNSHLVLRVQSRLAMLGVDSLVFQTYPGNGYTASMRALAKRIDDSRCTHGVEFHFNSAGPLAHGHEVLYFAGSVKGAKLATQTNNQLTVHFNTPNRGVKGLTLGDKGGGYLFETRVPAIIVEPFFGSSASDWNAMALHIEPLAEALAQGISCGIV